MKKILGLFLSVFMIMILVACAPAPTNDDMTEPAATEEGLLELTLEELKQYNGQNGQPAYVAVDGVIYDLTDVAAWPDGQHNGNVAGNDLTDVIKNESPHGLKVLEDKPVVGKLVD